VLDGTKLVGVLTERDLLRALSILMPDTPVDIEGFLW
jgi:CBS domain-containing protein